MRFFSPLLILAALLAAACGGAVLPDEFTRERADGKIPVSIPLIREQTRKEIDGMPEGQAKAERWQQIEKDHNQCRLLSVRSNQAEANEVFAACMSKRDYLYMFRLDAEHLHNDIAAAESVNYAAEKKAIEDAHLAAEKKAEEERQRKEHAAAVERQREEERLAAERRREEEARREAAHRREQERLATEHRRKQQEAERKRQEEQNSALLEVRRATERRINARHLSHQLANAAKKGDLLEVRRLIAAGANLNQGDYSGGTALMNAADESHIEIVKMLLAAGANPNAVGEYDWTALMVAARGHVEATRMLIAAGANLHAVDNYGATALMKASFLGQAKIAKMLLVAGANPNATEEDGSTALMWAIASDTPEAVKTLLACGASLDIKDIDGETAWDYAKNHPLILPILKKHKAAIEAGRKPKSCEAKR